MGPSQIAIPLLKVMSYVIPVHMHNFPLSINPPPYLPYIIFVQTCDKRLDLPKFVDVLLPLYTGGYIYIYCHTQYVYIVYICIYIYICVRI